MNVSGSEKKVYLINPKLVIFQASIFGFFFSTWKRSFSDPETLV